MRNTVLSLLLLLSVSGCSMMSVFEDQPPPSGDEPTPTLDQRPRLEDTWGPGEWAALLTGTFSSKDRNFSFNLPLISWYVRESERKGLAILGGALAYDMISVEYEEGRPRWRKLTSVGPLGIGGNITRESVLGDGQFRKTHWFFPFYRYHNTNGERIVYPLMIFPWALPPAEQTVPPETWGGEDGFPIDPEPIQRMPRAEPGMISADAPEIQPRPSAQPRFDPDPSLIGRPQPAISSSDPGSTGDSDVTATSGKRTSGNVAEGTLRPRREDPRNRPVTPPKTEAQRYTVKSGDTLYGLARRFYGSGEKWRRIYEANEAALRNRDTLKIGTTLVIPAAE